MYLWLMQYWVIADAAVKPESVRNVKNLKKDYVYECNFSSNIAIVIIPHVTIDKTKMYKSYRYNHKTAHKCNMKRNVLYSGVLWKQSFSNTLGHLGRFFYDKIPCLAVILSFFDAFPRESKGFPVIFLAIKFVRLSFPLENGNSLRQGGDCRKGIGVGLWKKTSGGRIWG